MERVLLDSVLELAERRNKLSRTRVDVRAGAHNCVSFHFRRISKGEKKRKENFSHHGGTWWFRTPNFLYHHKVKIAKTFPRFFDSLTLLISVGGKSLFYPSGEGCLIHYHRTTFCTRTWVSSRISRYRHTGYARAQARVSSSSRETELSREIGGICPSCCIKKHKKWIRWRFNHRLLEWSCSRS